MSLKSPPDQVNIFFSRKNTKSQVQRLDCDSIPLRNELTTDFRRTFPPLRLWLARDQGVGIHLGFICPRCGEYRVDEQTFRAFLTAKLNGVLDARFSRGDVAEAVNEFDGFCPRCRPNSDVKVTLTIRRVKECQL
jgi:hypothetical protein